MRRPILCQERLNRIEDVLRRNGGKLSMRDLWRSCGIFDWEIEQAAQMGSLKISIRKPKGRGRPSTEVEFRDGSSVNTPPPRRQIEPGISIRHSLFAMKSVFQCVKGGMPRYGLPGVWRAYQEVYQPKSRVGARASATRLMKRRDVRAARQWFFARVAGEIPKSEAMPDTVSGIRDRLRKLGNERAKRF